MAVRIVTDSTSYIDELSRQKLNIQVVPLNINFARETLKENEISHERFYSRLASSPEIPTSSQPSPADFLQVYESLLKAGHQVLVITLSSEISGTYNSALQARDMIQESNPGAEIVVIDSRAVAMALGLVVLKAATLAREGKSLAEVTEYSQRIKNRVHLYFVPATLEYLIKGGRLTGTRALLGTVLKIKPVLALQQGRVEVIDKARGFHNGVKNMLSLLGQAAREAGLGEVVIHHVINPDKARELADLVAEAYGIQAPIIPVGPVVGLHGGPGAVGIAFCTERDRRS